MKFENFLKDDKEESLPALITLSLFVVTTFYFVYNAVVDPTTLDTYLLGTLYAMCLVGGGGDKAIKSKHFKYFNKKRGNNE